jgi:spore maturation protein CgeB
LKILVLGSTIVTSGDVSLCLTKALRAIGRDARLLSVDDTGSLISDLTTRLRHPYFRRLRGIHYAHRVLNEVRHWKPELVLIYGSNTWLYPHALSEIKNLGCQIALWEVNNRFFNGTYAEGLPYYNHVFVLDSYFIPLLQSFGVKNVSHLSACVDPEECCPHPLSDDDPYSCDISFLGSLYPNRMTFFRKLAKRHHRINLYVSSAYKQNPDIGQFVKTEPVLGISKAKIFSNSKISINIQGPFMVYGENFRVFEVAACKGVSFSTYKPDLTLSFTPDKEIILFDGPEDFTEKADYYLSHPADLRTIAENSYRRSLAEHTYEHRARELLDTLGY